MSYRRLLRKNGPRERKRTKRDFTSKYCLFYSKEDSAALQNEKNKNDRKETYCIESMKKMRQYLNYKMYIFFKKKKKEVATGRLNKHGTLSMATYKT